MFRIFNARTLLNVSAIYTQTHYIMFVVVFFLSFQIKAVYQGIGIK